jgi:hypothetical protein
MLYLRSSDGLPLSDTFLVDVLRSLRSSHSAFARPKNDANFFPYSCARFIIVAVAK